MPERGEYMPTASEKTREVEVQGEDHCVTSIADCLCVNGADDTATLPTVSPPSSPATGERPVSVAEKGGLSSNEMTSFSISGANEVVPLDMQRNEHAIYYVEAAQALRRVGKGIDAKERFLREEIQRQTELYQEKKNELLEKKISYDLLEQTTSRLTCQLRALDSENDRLRDQLEQLQEAIRKVTSRRALHAHQKQVQGATRCVGSRHSSALETTTLTNMLKTYQKKLRSAEAEHAKIMDDLQLAVARRRGRAAAHAVFPSEGLPSTIPRISVSSIEEYSEANLKYCFSKDYNETDSIRQLETMIDDVLSVSRQQFNSVSFSEGRGIDKKYHIPSSIV